MTTPHTPEGWFRWPTTAIGLNNTNIYGLVDLFGGYSRGGINWTWAYFSTELQANAFHLAITSDPTIETRGVYSPNNNSYWGVRWR